ncbi:MAG: TonB-dependent receptor [Bryobacterales bacterium]|nr:TonB-dependent receptor [Bryobacterales bacterium]
MRTTTAVLLALASVPAMYAAPNQLTGSIAGIVSNTVGIPQMGATVLLFNKLERQIARVLTDDRGSFTFDSLPSDVYSVRVTLASFMPAVRSNIGVQPGLRRILSINLAGVLSTIELVYSLPVQQGLMSEDWKWTLRSALATRPILRVLSADARDPLRQMRAGQGMFSHTRGVVKLSAGDNTSAPTLGSAPDLGTAFAVATSIYGANNVEVSGNVGIASASGNPAASFRTSFSRDFGAARSPELAVTMRQIFATGQVTNRMLSGQGDVPAFRSMAISMNDKLQVTDNLAIQYGATLESVQFLQRLNYMSPYAKLSYALDEFGVVELGYSSGLPPTQFYTNGAGNDESEMQQQQLAGLSTFPRVSLRNGRTEVQRAENFELGLRKKVGSYTFSAGAYKESFKNAVLTAMGADGAFASGELLPDMFSTASLFNAGRYRSIGYMAAVAQELSDNWTVTLGYGNSGVLEATRDQMASELASELRSALQTKRRHLATMQLAGLLETTGTRLSTSYQFMNGKALTPGHFYMTQRMNPQRGLNVQVRQPIPFLGMRGGKVEATADIRNILAQGYQPMTLSNGRRLQLVHSPRALRGGLAFIF